MSGPLLDPKEIKAPKWMTAAERAVFRHLIKAEIEQNRYISIGKRDQIADYICASTRLDDLRDRLAKEIAAASPRDVDKARILSLNGQINTLTALRQKLGDAL